MTSIWWKTFSPSWVAVKAASASFLLFLQIDKWGLCLQCTQSVWLWHWDALCSASMQLKHNRLLCKIRRGSACDVTLSHSQDLWVTQSTYTRAAPRWFVILHIETPVVMHARRWWSWGFCCSLSWIILVNELPSILLRLVLSLQNQVVPSNFAANEFGFDSWQLIKNTTHHR